jgi:pimeloyl-ACP methyl ester carboxylesterase
VKAVGRWVAVAALVALCLYISLLGALYGLQRRAIYPGWWRGTAAVRVDTSGYRTIAITTADGRTGRLLYAPPRDGKPVILFFHGNGDSVLGGVVALEQLVAAGYGAVIPEYRGYNGNPGTPDEQGLYADARAARAWMTANGITASRTIVFGYSIGSGLAVQSALETPPAALILVAGHAGIAHVVGERLPFVPGWLVSERFDNAAKIGRVGCPILLVHGMTDGTIPVDNARLLASIQPRATMVLIPGTGHDVVWNRTAQRKIAAWLKEQRL